MEYALTPILILVFLLPGLFFFRGISSFSYAYVSQSLLSWKTPSVLSITFLASILIHGFLLTIFIFVMSLFEIIFDINIISIFGQNSFLFLQWLPLYVILAAWLSNIVGLLSIEYELINEKKILQIFKHKWIETLLQQIFLYELSERKEKELFNATIFIKESVSYNGNHSNLVYVGEVVDFFLSSDGKFEYIVLESTQKSDTSKIELGKSIDLEAYQKILSPEKIQELNQKFSKENIKNVWTTIKTNSNYRIGSKDIFYVEGDKILNVLMSLKDIDFKGISLEWKKHFKVSRLILWFMAFLLFFVSVNTIFFLKDYEDEKKPKAEGVNLNLNSSFNAFGQFFANRSEIENVKISNNKLQLATNGSYINVRSSPSKFAKIIVNLHDKGTEIKTLKEVSENDNWYEVELSDGSIGYIFSDLLSEKTK